MTRTEYNQLLSQLPESIRKEYGFNEPFDYSPYKCVHTDEYDYYPELDCCIIDEIPIVWADNNPWVTPENPEILKEFKQRIANKQEPVINVIDIGKNTHKMAHFAYTKTKANMQSVKDKNLKPIRYKNITVYYDPNNIDLPNNQQMMVLAICLITAKQYNAIGIDPKQNIPPNEWENISFIGEQAND